MNKKKFKEKMIKNQKQPRGPINIDAFIDSIYDLVVELVNESLKGGGK